MWAVYTRISKDGRGSGLGVARQLAEIRDYVDRVDPGAVVVVFSDNDMSGYRVGVVRPEWEDMLTRITAGEFSAVIAWHADRFTRQTLQLATLIRACDVARSELHTVLGGHHADPMGLEIQGIVAAQESRQKGRRMESKHKQMAEQGRHPGGARRFGYTARMASVDEAEAAVIRDVAERALNGESLSSIARSLNVAGIPTATGKAAWRPQTVRQMLLGLHLTGWRELHGTRYRAEWTAILDLGTHEALALKFGAGDRVTNGGNNSTRYLLSGIARCGKCDAPMRARSALYRCAACGGVSRKRADIDTRVSDAAVAFLSSRDEGGLLVTDDTAQERAALMAERADIPARREAKADANAEGRISDEAYESSMAAFDRREKAIADALALLAETTAGPTRALRGATGPSAGAVWDGWTNDPTGAGLARQRAILALADIVIHPAGKGARKFDPATVSVTWRDIG